MINKRDVSTVRKIIKEIRQRGFSIEEISKRTGLSVLYLMEVLNGEKLACDFFIDSLSIFN